MTSYAEMDRVRKMARPLYLELRALDLEPRAIEDSEDPTGHRIRVRGLASVSERHKDRILSRVENHKPGLVKLLVGRWDPDLEAIRGEGRRA